MKLTTGMLLAMAEGWALPKIANKQYKPKTVKSCINCGKEHTHNNSFCSAKCCKEYK